MNGLIYVDQISPDAVSVTSDGMVIRFVSDGATFAFRLSHHAGVAFEQKVKRNAKQLHSPPSGELVALESLRQRRNGEVR